MAKDFGSSEGCVKDEEIFFRGKQTAEHEYKYFGNAFLCLTLGWVECVSVRKVAGAGVEAIVVQIRWQLAPMIENHSCQQRHTWRTPKCRQSCPY